MALTNSQHADEEKRIQASFAADTIKSLLEEKTGKNE